MFGEGKHCFDRMEGVQTENTTSPQPLRLWPGVVAVVAQWLARFGVPAVVPGAVAFGVFGGLLGGLMVVLWWVLFSRAPRYERWGAIGLMFIALAGTYSLNHESMGQLWLVSYAGPVLGLAFVVGTIITQRLPDRTRRVAVSATILLACGAWTTVRSRGITGDGAAEFAWRWSETPEDRLVAQTVDEAMESPPGELAGKGAATWPGFRGPRRDNRIPGTRIETDWSLSPPVELWRRPIGPGWGSFAVQGDYFYTQEQRGDDEVVASYRVSTGEPVWKHHTVARFWESQAGVGPRATPTLSEGRLYALGATGILSVLNAQDGTLVWSRNVAFDTGAPLPDWGFASSPLVTSELVIVAASGALVAYDLASGDPRWFGPAGGVSYSSPHLLTIDGVEQTLMLNDTGAMGISPSTGTLLWEHSWPGFRIVQPALTADGDVLLCSERNGTRRLDVSRGPGGWSVEEQWTSIGLKPYFSDFVVHDGHAYGFDGNILASLDLRSGQRNWKGGRYGHGQLLLFSDQDLLLVISENGEVALVSASPDNFAELARFHALEGKTWNHPVLVGDRLLVRNSQEVALYRLPSTATPRPGSFDSP